jgi:hypothetical protein
MSTQNHTIGPWVYSPAVACVFVEAPHKHCPQICTLPAFAPENTTNGALIAAAPELLEALEDAAFILRMAGKIAGPMQDSFKRSAEDAAKVIAKAQGKP